MLNRPKPISDDDLKKYLEVIIKQLLEKKPELAKDQKLVNELVNESMKLIHEQFIDLPHEKTLNNLREPHFLQKLALSLTLTAEIKGDKQLANTLDKALDKLLKDPKFIAEFRKISPKDIEASSKLDKLLDKFLNKEQKDMLKDVLKKINGMLDKKCNTAKDKDGKLKNESPDEYVNIYGIINSKIAGGIAVPVFTNFGTRDFVDQNPNIGSAPIDRVNDTNDTGLGDANGLNAKAMQNFSKIAGTIISSNEVSAMQTGLDDAGMTPSTAPKLQRH